MSWTQGAAVNTVFVSTQAVERHYLVPPSLVPYALTGIESNPACD